MHNPAKPTAHQRTGAQNESELTEIKTKRNELARLMFEGLMEYPEEVNQISRDANQKAAAAESERDSAIRWAKAVESERNQAVRRATAAESERDHANERATKAGFERNQAVRRTTATETERDFANQRSIRAESECVCYQKGYQN